MKTVLEKEKNAASIFLFSLQCFQPFHRFYLMASMYQKHAFVQFFGRETLQDLFEIKKKP